MRTYADSLASIPADGQSLATQLPASTLGELDVVVRNGHGRASNGNHSDDLRELHFEKRFIGLNGGKTRKEC